MDPLYEHCSATLEAFDDGTLSVTVGGDAREEDIEPFFEVFQPLLEERAPARILVDATEFAGVDRRVRWELVKRMRANKPLIERTAIFGLSERLETLLWILFSISGRSNIRTFLWRHEAWAWLSGGPLP